jgi:transposase-like protein
MLDHIPLADDRQASDLRSTLKKRQILDGARQVFLLNGYAGASMDEIALQAGVSKGTLYNRHRQVVEEGYTDPGSRLDQATVTAPVTLAQTWSARARAPR